jgi:hypothetical protein
MIEGHPLWALDWSRGGALGGEQPRDLLIRGVPEKVYYVIADDDVGRYLRHGSAAVDRWSPLEDSGGIDYAIN